MSSTKKLVAKSYAEGCSVNQIADQLFVMKRHRGNTCFTEENRPRYIERLKRYVRSEIARLERNKPSSSSSSTLSPSPCDRPTAESVQDQPTSPSLPLVVPSPISQAQCPPAH